MYSHRVNHWDVVDGDGHVAHRVMVMADEPDQRFDVLVDGLIVDRVYYHAKETLLSAVECACWIGYGLTKDARVLKIYRENAYIGPVQRVPLPEEVAARLCGRA